jgi:MFS family permease
MSWGWRLPFLGSAVLVLLGLWVRLSIDETPEFQRVLDRNERRAPAGAGGAGPAPARAAAGVFGSLATFVLFYLMTVFALSWGTTALGYPREQFLWLQMLGVLFFAATIPIAASLADRRGRRLAMLVVTAAIFGFGLAFENLFVSGSPAGALLFLALGLALMGFTYGPLGTLLAEMFPAPVRYSGTSLAFNLSGILGASLAPYIAIWLATHHGLAWVGHYLALAALLSFAALLAARPHSGPVQPAAEGRARKA